MLPVTPLQIPVIVTITFHHTGDSPTFHHGSIWPRFGPANLSVSAALAARARAKSRRPGDRKLLAPAALIDSQRKKMQNSSSKFIQLSSNYPIPKSWCLSFLGLTKNRAIWQLGRLGLCGRDEIHQISGPDVGSKLPQHLLLEQKQKGIEVVNFWIWCAIDS